MAIIFTIINITFVVISIISLKRFYAVKNNFIFKKRHSILTIASGIIITLNILNGTLILIFDHIFTSFIKFSMISTFIYIQYASMFLLIMYTVTLKTWMNYYDTNFSATLINNEWKSLIDPTINNYKINWFIKHKHTFGNIKYWIKYIIFIYLFSLILMLLLEALFCWTSHKNYNKCYHLRNSFQHFTYRQTIFNYDNYIAIIFVIASWILIVTIRYKTNSFKDSFYVKKEIQYLLYCSTALIFNIPHIYICYAIENKKYQLLGTNDHKIIQRIWSISACLTITQYNLFSIFAIYIMTIWSISANKISLQLFSKKIDNKQLT
eukprot:167062_1